MPVPPAAADAAGDPGRTMIAARLVNELMLVSVLVAGEGAPSLAGELEAEGSAAEVFAGGPAAEGFDLAILLALPGSAGDPRTRQLVDSLARASERLLFAPLPLGASDGAETPALPQLTEWFEVFAEFGYQPVVEFDASFVAPGAFLVDRAATAAESELAAFADRLQLGAAPVDPASAPPALAREQDVGLQARLAEAEAALSEARASLAQSRAEASALLAQAARQAEQSQAIEALQTADARWDGLRHWARAVVADPRRDRPAALARNLPRLNAWRSPASPIALPRAWSRLRVPRLRVPWLRLPDLRPTPFTAILADTALVRASRLFDAAWYVAATPELAEDPSVDPVFHYVLVGGPRGADPGPWFDTEAYLAAHPGIAGACPLVHAIRTNAEILQLPVA